MQPAADDASKDDLEAQGKPRAHKIAKRPFDIVRLAILAVAIVIGGLGWMYYNHHSDKLPASLKKSVNFAVYYPSALPSGYSLDKKSPTVDKGILFYSLSNIDKKISISEQSAPKNPPDFDIIQKGNTSFKKLDVIAGQAIYGVSQQVPAAILLTNTTLVNINGSKNTPIDVIAKMTQNMSSSY